MLNLLLFASAFAASKEHPDAEDIPALPQDEDPEKDLLPLVPQDTQIERVPSEPLVDPTPIPVDFDDTALFRAWSQAQGRHQWSKTKVRPNLVAYGSPLGRNRAWRRKHKDGPRAVGVAFYFDNNPEVFRWVNVPNHRVANQRKDWREQVRLDRNVATRELKKLPDNPKETLDILYKRPRSKPDPRMPPMLSYAYVNARQPS